MQRITPCLWFDSDAEEAARFYTSVFKRSKITAIDHYGPAGAKVSGKPEGSVWVVAFEIDGQPFLALNGGPEFTFSPATSFIVNCKTQAEVDDAWDKLSAGGEIQGCGWLTDRFGVTWQIVPTVLLEMLQDQDVRKSERVWEALHQMKKIDIAALEKAYAQR